MNSPTFAPSDRLHQAVRAGEIGDPLAELRVPFAGPDPLITTPKVGAAV